MSQVGCRLMVASMAKISRPRPDTVVGVMDFTRARKASTSLPLERAVSTAPPLSVFTGVFD
jgi:hypothetical protein